MDRYRDVALDNPTVENVRAYMLLQRLSLDKAQQFSDTTRMVVVGDPYLDENNRRPFGSAAAQTLAQNSGREQRGMVSLIAQRTGLFFFYDSSDVLSLNASPIVKMLENMHGFDVLPISMDGKALGDGTYPEFKTDNGQAEILGVVTTPAIYLVGLTDEGVEPIAQGPVSLEGARERIILAALRRGWISSNEYEKTRPILNNGVNIAEVIQSAPEVLASSSKGSEFAPPIPPQTINELFRSQLTLLPTEN